MDEVCENLTALVLLSSSHVHSLKTYSPLESCALAKLEEKIAVMKVYCVIILLKVQYESI